MRRFAIITLLAVAGCAGGASVSSPVLIGNHGGVPLWQFSAASTTGSNIRSDAARLSQDLCAGKATLVDVQETYRHGPGALQRWNATFTCPKIGI